MKPGDMVQRTRDFAVRVVKLVDSLPAGRTADVMARQILRCATSVGANYRAACRGRTKAEFAAKLGIVEEEADECLYWFDLLSAAGLVPPGRLTALQQEANEILSIIIASIRTARRNNRPPAA